MVLKWCGCLARGSVGGYVIGVCCGMTVQSGVLAQRPGWGWDGYATAHRPNWQSQRTYEDFGSGSQGPQVLGSGIWSPKS